jgi:hypothetical protein
MTMRVMLRIFADVTFDEKAFQEEKPRGGTSPRPLSRARTAAAPSDAATAARRETAMVAALMRGEAAVEEEKEWGCDEGGQTGGCLRSRGRASCIERGIAMRTRRRRANRTRDPAATAT